MDKPNVSTGVRGMELTENERIEIMKLAYNETLREVTEGDVPDTYENFNRRMINNSDCISECMFHLKDKRYGL